MTGDLETISYFIERMIMAAMLDKNYDVNQVSRLDAISSRIQRWIARQGNRRPLQIEVKTIVMWGAEECHRIFTGKPERNRYDRAVENLGF